MVRSLFFSMRMNQDESDLLTKLAKMAGYSSESDYGRDAVLQRLHNRTDEFIRGWEAGYQAAIETSKSSATADLHEIRLLLFLLLHLARGGTTQGHYNEALAALKTYDDVKIAFDRGLPGLMNILEKHIGGNNAKERD